MTACDFLNNLNANVDEDSIFHLGLSSMQMGKKTRAIFFLSALRRIRSEFLSALFFQVSENDMGSCFKLKLCINLIRENSISLSSGSIFCSLKRGAVWALKIELHII
jgi:hypothetical protein